MENIIKKFKFIQFESDSDDYDDDPRTRHRRNKPEPPKAEEGSSFGRDQNTTSNSGSSFQANSLRKVLITKKMSFYEFEIVQIKSNLANLLRFFHSKVCL